MRFLIAVIAYLLAAIFAAVAVGYGVQANKEAEPTAEPESRDRETLELSKYKAELGAGQDARSAGIMAYAAGTPLLNGSKRFMGLSWLPVSDGYLLVGVPHMSHWLEQQVEVTSGTASATLALLVHGHRLEAADTTLYLGRQVEVVPYHEMDGHTGHGQPLSEGLPPGLAWDGTSIEGVPTEAGEFAVRIKCGCGQMWSVFQITVVPGSYPRSLDLDRSSVPVPITSSERVRQEVSDGRVRFVLEQPTGRVWIDQRSALRFGQEFDAALMSDADVDSFVVRGLPSGLRVEGQRIVGTLREPFGSRTLSITAYGAGSTRAESELELREGTEEDNTIYVTFTVLAILAFLVGTVTVFWPSK